VAAAAAAAAVPELGVPTLRTLSLADNPRLGTGGGAAAAPIFKALEQNTTLASLDVSRCALTDAAAPTVGGMLHENLGRGLHSSTFHLNLSRFCH